MCQIDCDALRDWATSFGPAVRQRTGRQETTMVRHGTPPEFMYQRQYEVFDMPVRYAFDEKSNTSEAATGKELEEEETEEFDQRSDEAVVEDGREATTLLQREID